MERKKITFIVIALLLVLLVIVELVAYVYFRKKDVGVLPDSGSVRRIQTINQILIAYFGNNWPTVLISILVLIIVILGLLLLVSKKEVDIGLLDEKAFKWINIASVTFLAVVTLGVLYAVYRIYADAREAKVLKSPTDENLEAINKQKKELIQFFVAIIGLIFLILLLLGGGLWGYRKLKAKLGQ